VITFLPIKTDFKVCIVAGEGSNFCTIEGKDMIDNGIDGFLRIISIVKAEIVVEPTCLVTRQPVISI
jgi:hypothetical protein